MQAIGFDAVQDRLAGPLVERLAAADYLTLAAAGRSRSIGA